MRPLRRLVLLFPLALAAACGDDSHSTDGGPADAAGMDARASDAGLDGGPAPDASIDAAPDSAADAGPPLPSPRPVAPPHEPEPLPIASWFQTAVSDPSASDPVMDQIEQGTFEPPPGEGVFRGVDWGTWTPGEHGELRAISSGVLWAATTIHVEATTRLVVRADGVISVHVGTARQPGDLYAAGNKRVPLVLPPGDDVLAVRAAGGRGRPAVELWTTPDELWLNTSDATSPDFRDGEMTEQWLGVHVLALTEAPVLGVTARVVDSDDFEETTTAYPSLAAGAVTQLAFRLVPKRAFAATEMSVGVRVRVESDSLRWSYEREVAIPVVASDAVFRRTFRSAVDGSAQYFAVRPPSGFDPGRDYALVLSLHGAGVEAAGQAAAYSPKDWAYVVAPTNRRPFGFDWEAWGRLDAIEVLDEAMRVFRIDPTRVYLTGHSMGGHGSWQVGVLFPGRFALVGPSSGWSSFYSYTGQPRPGGAFARSEASSDTNVYLGNLARRAVYVLHGDADDNVPVREARDMVAACTPIVPDLQYHEQPGAGHWWDGDASPGVDCVDWPALFDTMHARTLDPFELDFDFLTPGPWVNPHHSYVTLRAALDTMQDLRVVSVRSGSTVTLTTTNVRGMVLDGAALHAHGIDRVVVDGTPHDVADGEMPIGPQDGKHPGVHGPVNEVFSRPFCFVHPDDGPDSYLHYAAFVLSSWALVGNGHGCALPMSAVTPDLADARNLVFLGVPREAAAWPDDLPFEWSAGVVSIGGGAPRADAALAFVHPRAGYLAGGFVATAGSEYLLFRIQPFGSGFALPDYLVWSEAGGVAAGMMDATWHLP